MLREMTGPRSSRRPTGGDASTPARRPSTSGGAPRPPTGGAGSSGKPGETTNGSATGPGKPRLRWLRVLGRIGEVGMVLAATGTLALWCSVPNTAPLAEENPASTAFIDLRRAQAADAGRQFKLQWQWRPIGKISRFLRAAIIYAEDYKFHHHDGVDWDAIEDAFEANLDKGSFAIGGSTITQQLAKNLYLSPSRSMIRKAREMLIAFSLEDHLSKQRILELYLNVVEWGDGVFGAEAAAHHWFGHSARTLSPAEAVRLAIALPNPITRAPNLRSPDLTKKAVRIIRLLRMQGLIDEAQEREALDQVGAHHEQVLPTRSRPDAKDGGQQDPPQPAPGQPRPDPGQPPPDPAQPDTLSPDSGQPHPDPGQPDTLPPDPQPDTPRPDPGQPSTGQPGNGSA